MASDSKNKPGLHADKKHSVEETVASILDSDNLPSDKKQKLLHELVVTGEQFSGPLPPPQILAGYDRVYPGAAKKIVNQAMMQTTHRMSLESKVVQSNITNERLGVVLAFILASFMIIGGFVLILNGQNVAGFALVLGQAAILIYNFYSQKSKESNRIKAKDEELLPED